MAGVCYCGGSPGPGEPGEHAACVAEWKRRADGGLCVRCGRADAVAATFRCAGCDRPGSPWLGFSEAL